MKLGGFSKVLGQLYTDRLSISRYEQTVAPDGTTSISRNPVPVYTDVPCRVSFNQNDNPASFEDDANPIFIQVKVFCSTVVDLKKGDFIAAERLDEEGTVLATYEGTCNLPVMYVTHQEAEIIQEGNA